MKFVSTRGQTAALTFSEALGRGLAEDGGLFVPERFPQFSASDFSLNASFAEFGAQLLRPFLEGDALLAQLHDICAAAFNFEIPLRNRDDGTAVLELFHGPTAAFKDVGARFLAECVGRTKSPSRRTVIVATSGDTGGAVGGAFVGQPNIDVMILFPKGKISIRQEKQIACWGKNVKAFAVHGSFDDCQKIVKEALSDSAWSKEKNFVSANSISIGRLLPQMIYYAKSSLRYLSAHATEPTYIVPTGNLGNAVACMWAKKVGFPIAKIILATNANHSIEDYFESGEWKPNTTIATLANAMDVGNPSNMERLRALYPDLSSLKADISAISVSDENISETIRESFEMAGDIFCPHTATAVYAQKHLGIENAIVVSTAHPSKFETIVEPLIGKSVAIPPALEVLLERESVYTTIAPTLTALKG